MDKAAGMILKGHVIDRLRDLPAESVHCIVTSPPYYGLRNYGLEPVIWEPVRYAPMTGVPEIACPQWAAPERFADCDHTWNEWTENHDVRESSTHGKSRTTDRCYGDQTSRKFNGNHEKHAHGQVCEKCGAWRGCLGLESDPFLYIGHLVQVFQEARRVLRHDGTLFLNLGDSYYRKNPSGPQGKSGERAPRAFTASGLGGRRAKTCDTSGKEPANLTSHGCLYESLCDACRKAYRIGKSHSDGSPVPMLEPSLCASIPERMELPFVHLPTSDSFRPADRIEAASLAASHSPTREAGQPRASQVSTTPESSLRHQECSRRLGSSLVCLMCGTPLTHDAQKSVHTTVCTCDTETQSEPSRRDRSGKSSSDLAYPYFTTTPLKSKDLMGIPWRAALALQADGWWLRSDIVWAKPNAMPESVTDRPTRSHEMIFLFSKSQRYFYDHVAVRRRHSPESIARVQRKRAEHHKWENGPGQQSIANDLSRALHPDGANLRDVWNVSTKPFHGAHFAVFPPDLVDPMIRAGTSGKGVCPICGTPWGRKITKEIGDAPTSYNVSLRTAGWQPGCRCDTGELGVEAAPAVVLDPFGGSGTVAIAAESLGRDWRLIEANPEYAAMADARIREAREQLAGISSSKRRKDGKPGKTSAIRSTHAGCNPGASIFGCKPARYKPPLQKQQLEMFS